MHAVPELFTLLNTYSHLPMKTTEQWKYTTKPGSDLAEVTAKSGALICECDMQDAPIIAAAPELLAVVERLNAELGRAAANISAPRISVLREIHSAALAAIAKATQGQP